MKNFLVKFIIYEMSVVSNNAPIKKNNVGIRSTKSKKETMFEPGN